MKIEKFHLYLANLNPQSGTEPGKIRPVVVIQTNLLNNAHSSTLVCPITTKIVKGSNLLRVHLTQKESGLPHDSDILADQVRALDNRRFIKPIGKLAAHHQEKLLENLRLLILE